MNYLRAQCAIHIDTQADNLIPSMTFVAHELANVRNNGLNQSEFDALMARKTAELSTLFATYARTSTDVLMSQRLRSQQNEVVVDIGAGTVLETAQRVSRRAVAADA